MFEGTVRSFNSRTGYGFIISDKVDGDVYVHISNVAEENVNRLLPKQNVTFDLGFDDRQRRCALNIKIKR